MTFVGKVLVVLQVVLSLLFMVFAGAVFTAQTNWKKKSEDLTAQIALNDTNQQQTDADHQTELDDLFAKLTLTEDRAKNAEANLQDQTDRANSLGQELEKEKIRTSGLEQNYDIANTLAKDRRREAIALRVINGKLHKSIDKLVATNRALEEGKFSSNLERTTMLDKHKKILKELADSKLIIALNDYDTDPKLYRGKRKPPVNIEGKVLAARRGIRNEPDLIEISLGHDDDLLKGHELICYSKSGKGKYLGRIRIVYITPDKAVGVVIQKAKNGIIKEGDYVSPKL